MTREFVENIEFKLNINFGYIIRCDDIRKPKGVETDMYFRLWETERLIHTLELCEEYGLNYDFAFEEWDEENQEIEETMYVHNNYLNNC